ISDEDLMSLDVESITNHVVQNIRNIGYHNILTKNVDDVTLNSIKINDLNSSKYLHFGNTNSITSLVQDIDIGYNEESTVEEIINLKGISITPLILKNNTITIENDSIILGDAHFNNIKEEPNYEKNELAYTFDDENGNLSLCF